MATMARLMLEAAAKRRRALALAAEPGGLVLVAKRRPGAGVAISRHPGGGWRATYFDADGFSGHAEFADKAAAVLDCLGSYDDINRGLLRECMADPRFMAGVEYSLELERGVM